jgi:hypothetical protein
MAEKQTLKIGEGKPGPGRPKGVPNKSTTLLKDAILAAATKAGDKGGLVGYLTDQAKENPQSFLPLLGKVLPMQLTGEDGGAIQIEQRVREDAEFVAGAVASLVERARASGVAGSTQH